MPSKKFEPRYLGCYFANRLCGLSPARSWEYFHFELWVFRF